MIDFLRHLRTVAGSLLPLILVIGLFQLAVLRRVPEGMALMLTGLCLVAIGITLLLRGLDLSLFPVGRRLADVLAAKGSLFWLLSFGFALGVGSVAAEPALIAVADKAQAISDGAIRASTLRIVVALSVGLVVAIGMLRIVLDHPIQWYVLGGYLLLLPITHFTPTEITGLAFDAGAVSVNTITVPLLLALGMGLAAALRGRNVLTDGFGLLALAVLAPRIAVQIYGLLVYGTPASDAAPLAAYPVAPIGDMLRPTHGGFATLAHDLLRILQSLLPIVGVALLFQYVALRRPFAQPGRLAGGLTLLIVGLFLFVEGLRMGIFLLGERMAIQLGALDSPFYLYLFVFLVGIGTTLVEPALNAFAHKAREALRGNMTVRALRTVVALGVAVGMVVGVHRMLSGGSLELYLAVTIGALVVVTALTPSRIVALAYDVGGVATSDVTVPFITALGIALTILGGSNDALAQGFGLVAFASLFPIILVMAYACLVDLGVRARDSL
ncbi:MAG: DUF1538 domain-containing protein [Chromatiales bacterium]|jgi:hypothetical protein|nr:DUF1538 domain-containing protein [Chromatiales bacterium]MDX9768026.1 DUF1538 domain-containing protein [Ectothiorhodospiraceae bacterium]